MKLRRQGPLAAFVATMLVLIVGAFIYHRDTQETLAARDRVEHVWQVKVLLKETLTALLNAETGARGFLLTGNGDFLDPYNKGVVQFHRALDSLKETVSAQPDQIVRARTLEAAGRERLEILRRLLKTRDDTPAALKERGEMLMTGKTSMDEFRSLMREIERDEERRLSERQSNAANTLLRSQLSFYGMASLSVLAIVITFGSTQRHLLARERNEQEVRALNAALERRVEERTESLARSNQQMGEINRELEAFSYSVSHDLRAPLRHVSGFAELLQKRCADQLDDNGKRYLQLIHSSARHAGTLVDDLLSFSRMGRATLQVKDVDMQALVDQMLHDLEPDLEGRHVTWRVDAMPSTPGDREMLRLVWQNLLSNAIKYTRTRTEAQIEVSVQDADAEWIFSVRDNGVGFDMRYADKLFGVFQRLHRAEEFEGTGIGLANVRRIVTRHGGRTWAQSAPDQGAVFYFSLPKVPPGTSGAAEEGPV